jgi:ubiquitin carboxyl-terminal hydrolase 10
MSASPAAGKSILLSSPKVEPVVANQNQEHPAPKEESLPSVSIPPTVTSAKKSWASLLRPDGLSASSTRGPNALPVSSVVGFSIPGGAETPATGPLVTDKKQDLIALLTSGPVGPGPVPKIHPRGLINSGNMCFANAVLQVLIYCQPFYRLFMELEKYLPSSGGSGPMKKQDRKTFLIDATIQFLAEFNPPPSGDKRPREEDEEDDHLGSFMPGCIYDAMKEKKRFDNMRVRRFSHQFLHQLINLF